MTPSESGTEPQRDAEGNASGGPATPAEELVTIEILGLPVAIQARAQEHSDELIRELMLIGEQMRQSGDHAGLPARLVSLVEQLTGQYTPFTGEQEQQLADAVASGAATIDLVYRVPASVSDAARALDEILAEADDYCRAGEHLLTLPTPPDLVRYRHWFLDQFTQQVDGAEPVSFAGYRGREDSPQAPDAASSGADDVPARRR